MSVLKDHYKAISYGYNDARAYYYEQHSYPASLENFTEISDRSAYGFFAFTTALPVQFKTLDFGDNQKTVVRKLGKPRYISDQNAFSPCIYFYRETLLKHNLLIQLHFFEDQFVMATQTVIDTDAEWRQMVRVVILEKYLGQENTVVAGRPLSDRIDGNFSFTDGMGSNIFFIENINLNIVYSSSSPAHRSLIGAFADLKLKKIDDDKNALKGVLKNAF